MNSLCTTLKNLPDAGNMNRMRLDQCLKAFGLIPDRKPKDTVRLSFGIKVSSFQRSYYELIDLFHEAREHWKRGCRKIQTQFVSNHDKAAAWNALWLRIKKLFWKKWKIK